jgi:lysophospholipase L1-like esterase
MSVAPAPPRNEIPPGHAEVVWVALGDSFTAGTESGGTTWPTLVQRRLSKSRPLALIRLAREGAKTAEVEADQLPDGLAAEPDIVTLICGANDVILSVRPALERFEAELERCFKRIAAALPRARTLTATYPEVPPAELRPRTRRRIESGFNQVNSIIRAVASRCGVACVDFAKHPGQGDRSNYSADGFHPSEVGHRLAADAIGPALEHLIGTRELELA